MAVLKLSTPGVYVQEISSMPPSVAEVETAIPAFIGYTEKAKRLVDGDLIKIPTKINNLTEFELYFGGAAKETNDSITITVIDDGSGQYELSLTPVPAKRSKYNLYYSMKHFYDNGGGTCYVVSAGLHADGDVSSVKLIDALVLVQDIDEVTLLVVPEAAQSGTDTTYGAITQAMIQQAYDTKDRFALIDPYQVTMKNTGAPSGNIGADVDFIRKWTKGVNENRYAAAYYPNLITTYEYAYDFDNLTLDSYTWTGTGTAPAATDDKLSDVGAGSALYVKIKSELAKQFVTLPPSPAMAGIYTKTDLNKGVWKAPANETVSSVVEPNIWISSREQESLNIDPVSGKSINVIRTFPGFGTLVWGARTLNGNDNEWRYISVRRFFNMVEESIKKSSQWAVFEPNTINTWIKMKSMIENYLLLKWREGALAGATPEQAYYVNVGLGTTMTALDVLEGRLNVEIGMAVARPAEFIVLKFTQLMQQS